MNKYLRVNSIVLLSCFFLSVDGYAGSLYSKYMVEKKNISTECEKGNPFEGKAFFSINAVIGDKIYSFFSRRFIEYGSCLWWKKRADKFFKKSNTFMIEGESVDKNEKQKNGRDLYLGYFEQISTGKECLCWFDGCKCIPLEGVNYKNSSNSTGNKL